VTPSRNILIKNGRPKTTADTMFIRSRAPFRALANHAAVSVIVAQAMRRAGVFTRAVASPMFSAIQ